MKINILCVQYIYTIQDMNLLQCTGGVPGRKSYGVFRDVNVIIAGWLSNAAALAKRQKM